LLPHFFFGYEPSIATFMASLSLPTYQRQNYHLSTYNKGLQLNSPSPLGIFTSGVLYLETKLMVRFI
jgi:hypothetical protein